MPKCEWCKNEFDREEAEEDFQSEYSDLSYERISKKLCGNCAIEAIEDEVDGVYFEECEKCGITFDLIEDSSEYDDDHPWYNGTTLRDCWSIANMILCCSCAVDLEEDEIRELKHRNL